MTSKNPMKATPACTRHHRRVWIASCDECTAWHLAALQVGHDAPRSRTGRSAA
jgi:hypothetical protein